MPRQAYGSPATREPARGHRVEPSFDRISTLSRSHSSPASSTMARSATAAVLAVLAFAFMAAAAAQSDETGRSLLVAKPKPTLKVNPKNVPKLKAKPTPKPKKVVIKTFTGKACAKFGQYGVGCSLCTATACVTCGGTYMKSGAKCVCKTGYIMVKGKGTCVVKPHPAVNAKPVASKPKPTKKPTKKPVKPVVTAPPSQANVADPKLKAATALKAACKGTATSGLKFTVLPKLYPFAQAAAACKAAGLKLSDIDLIFAGSKGAAIGNAALATVNKCVGVNKAVWFDTSLAAPACNAFVAVGSPSDAGTTTGRKLSAASQVLLTQEVPTGCKTLLPVLCV